jgi:hypothetical protein
MEVCPFFLPPQAKDAANRRDHTKNKMAGGLLLTAGPGGPASNKFYAGR